MKQAIKNKMSMLQIVGYGSGCLGANLMNNTVSSFISFYYTEVAGLPIAAVGVILLACRLLDGVSDLIMGAVVERTYTREGKARPWVKRMAIPFGLSIFLMFLSPSFGMTGKIIWAVCTYIAGIAIIYTAVMVPYNTLSAVSTEDVDERTKLVTARNMFGFVGPLVIGAVSMPIVNFLGAGQFAWSVLTGIYGVLGALCYLWVYFSVKEVGAEERYEEYLAKKDEPQTVAEKKEQRNLLDDLKALIQNKYWLIVLFIQLVIFFNYGVKAGYQTYYTKYALGDTNFYSFLSSCGMIPNIAICFMIPWLSKKFGKRRISAIGCFLAILGGIVMAVNPVNRTLILVSTLLNCAGMAPICNCAFAMLGDTAIYSEWKSGVRNEGLLFSAESFAEKVGGALGGAAVAFALSLGGFVGNAAVQTESAMAVMTGLMVWFPVAVAVICIIALVFYDLDGKYDTLFAEVMERRNKSEK